MPNRNVLYLALCQGFMLSSTSLIIASSALVGVVLAPEPWQRTLPLGFMFFSMMATMIPASLLMLRFGRRFGFVMGACAGLCGGLIAAYSIYVHSFVGFCGASILLGIANGTSQFYRFAAVEVVNEEYRSRSISWVLAGGLLAAFVGPNVAHLTRDLIPGAIFAGSYGSIALFASGVIVVQFLLKIPMPRKEDMMGERRPMRFVLTRPVFLLAVICGMTAYGTMNLLMVSTPLAMGVRHMPFTETASVIQWHIVGMFLPSFFTGHLIQKYGVFKVMFVGGLFIKACVLVVLTGTQYVNFLTGLVLLGIGWNFLFVGATTLLTEAYLPPEKGIVQGINDFCVFSMTGLSALTASFLLNHLGWEKLNLYTMPVLVMVAISILWLGLLRRKAVRAKAQAQQT